MEKIEYIPAANKPLLKWIAVILVVVVFSAAILFMAGRAALGTPADIQASDSYYQAYLDAANTSALMTEENEAMVAELESMRITDAQKDALIAEQADTISVLTTEKAAHAEEIAALQQQLDALIAKYSTEYYVVFEVRRDGLIEDIITVTATVPEDVYNQYQIGTEVTQPSPYLSIPNDWMTVTWTVTVQNKYPSSVNVI